MKKLIFFTCSLWSTICFSQTEIGTIFQNNMNTIYQSLDRTPVTTGLLKDYGISLARFQPFNRVLSDNNKIDFTINVSL
jgi:hypothetical protein